MQHKAYFEQLSNMGLIGDCFDVVDEGLKLGEIIPKILSLTKFGSKAEKEVMRKSIYTLLKVGCIDKNGSYYTFLVPNEDYKNTKKYGTTVFSPARSIATTTLMDNINSEMRRLKEDNARLRRREESKVMESTESVEWGDNMEDGKSVISMDKDPGWLNLGIAFNGKSLWGMVHVDSVSWEPH